MPTAAPASTVLTAAAGGGGVYGSHLGRLLILGPPFPKGAPGNLFPLPLLGESGPPAICSARTLEWKPMGCGAPPSLMVVGGFFLLNLSNGVSSL